ncbi:MAG: Ran-binding zinc finger domain-containing protein [Gemmatimonadota bacterium]
MVDHISHSDDPIDRLLQERQQFAVWIARLDTTKDSVPESVRTRVRADYQARLDAVIDQLRTHGQGLAQQLERLRDSRGELLTREAQAGEIMAEAEVRHAVGEYEDAKWEQIRGEAQRNLSAVQEDLGRINGEIGKLEEVQGMIAAPAMVEPPAPPPPAAAIAPPASMPSAVAPDEPFAELSAALQDAVSSRPADQADAAPAPSERSAPPEPHAGDARAAGGPGAVRQVPTVRPVKPKEGTGTPGRTLWFPSVKEEEINAGVDELAFLKSVSEDEKSGPSPRRASGGLPRPAEALQAPPSPPSTVGSMGSGATAEGRPSTSTGQRTLKCGECGTMNRPTEWYCERCGAELADL